jgi:hypothetical protein
VYLYFYSYVILPEGRYQGGVIMACFYCETNQEGLELLDIKVPVEEREGASPFLKAADDMVDHIVGQIEVRRCQSCSEIWVCHPALPNGLAVQYDPHSIKVIMDARGMYIVDRRTS